MVPTFEVNRVDENKLRELVNIIFKKKIANVSSSVLQNVIVYLKLKPTYILCTRGGYSTN